MSRPRWNAAMQLALPQRFPGREADRANHVAVFDGRRGAFSLEIQAALRRFDLAGRNHRGHENAIGPRDRRRPAVSWNRRLPLDVLRGAPGVGKIRALADAVAAG